MRNPTPKLCSVDWCIRNARANGLCPAHYRRQKNGTNMDAFLEDLGYCEVPDCGRTKTNSNYCQMHYRRYKKGADLSTPSKAVKQYCSVEDCARGVKARGLCTSHYSRYKLGKEVNTPLITVQPQTVTECIVDNCHQPPSAKNLCQRHTVQRLNYNITAEDVNFLSNTPCMICGDEMAHIDHDSSCCPTGNSKKCGACVRGSLCANCNRALGMMKDDPNRLLNAFEYLESWSRSQSMYRTIR